MLVLYHFDWGGTDERLKAHDEAWKNACEKTEGAEYLGRYNPWNKKYHWTAVTKVKDLPTWYEVTKKFEWKRDLKAARAQGMFSLRSPSSTLPTARSRSRNG